MKHMIKIGVDEELFNLDIEYLISINKYTESNICQAVLKNITLFDYIVD